MPKITEYPSITTIDASTVLLADGNSGTSIILASDLAKYTVEEYGESTLLRNQQSVKEAFDKIALFPRTNNKRLVYENGTMNCDELTAEWTLAKGTNFPVNSTFWYVYSFAYTVDSNGFINAGRQIAYGYTDQSIYIRRKDSGSAWTDWKCVADGSERNTDYSLTGGPVVESGFDWDTTIAVGNYCIPTTALADASIGTKPIPHPIGYLKVMKSRDTANYVNQIFYTYDDLTCPFARNYVINTQTWSAWRRLPATFNSGFTETVTASTDINDYITPGTYFFNSQTKALNAPNNSGYFRLTVTAPTGSLTGTNRVRHQKALTSDGLTFERLLNSSNSGSTWTAGTWKRVGGNGPSFDTSGTAIASVERLTAATDINQILVGEYFWSDAATRPTANIPEESVRGRLWALDAGGGSFYCAQICYTSGYNWYVRYCTSAGNKTWTEWNKLPTREEISRISWDTLGDVRITTELTAYIDTLPPGVYYRHSATADAATVGAPVSSWCFYEIRKHGPEHVVVIATRGSTNGAPFRYQKEKYGSTWDSDWRAISNGDTSFTSRFSVSDTAKTITVPGSMRSILVVTDANVDNSGLYFVSTSSAGKATVREIIGSGALDIDASTTGQITLRATSSTITLGCLFFCTNAHIPTV